MQLPLVLAACLALNVAVWLFLRRFRNSHPRATYAVYGAIVAVCAALTPALVRGHTMPNPFALVAFTLISALASVAINTSIRKPPYRR